MYDDRCKDCENLQNCMHMMNMSMMNMPMMNMSMMHTPMMNTPMMNSPMMNMPMLEEDDDENKDLKKMYPKIYMKIHPMVKKHCDMMESMHGAMYCPSKEEMEHICKEICDKYDEHHRDDGNENNGTRQLGHGGRGITQDLIRILFIRDLLGRRRRRRPHFGY